MVCNAELTAAVAEAGGLGLLAGWNIADVAVLKAKLDSVRRLTRKPFGANLMAMNPKALDMAKMLLDNGIKTFTVSAGNPSEIVPFLKARGAFVVSVTGSVSAAKKAAALGVDAIVAEGTESGGLQGHNVPTTLVLVPQVVDAVDVPVLAAGGIADARGYRAAFALGAQGVQVGTCLVASKECIAHPRYKQLICQADDTGTRLINKGRIMSRSLSTPLVEQLLAQPGGMDRSQVTADQVEAAMIRGEIESYPLPAGQVAGLIHEVKTVRQIIEAMVAERLPLARPKASVA
jgi:enoyl-[acyl-carrier protein] reductase II